MFYNCSKLKSIAPQILKLYCYATNKNLWNCDAFRGCNSLQRLDGIDLGIMMNKNNNMCCSQPFKDCYEIESITFVNRTLNMKNQTLRLTGNVGYRTSVYTSKYNRNSAIETINSLPDYSGGSSNSIVFNGLSGRDTEGGAINTMTEEEVAVAVAKGWTVSYT
jgi:hypothetical protein